MCNIQSCPHRNPWLPGWILTTTLVLSVLVLIWICCATVATAVDQYVPAEVCFLVIFLAFIGLNSNVPAQSIHSQSRPNVLMVGMFSPSPEIEHLW